MYQGDIPFDRNGNQLSYADSWSMRNGGYWRKNTPFQATMKVIEIRRGRSAMQYILQDTQGHTYIMFPKDMLNLLQQFGVVMGVATPVMWTFVKRGSNYGVQAI
jgi:hypothetical protein